MRYALVTPAKDEEENLPHLIRSIKSLTVLPAYWVVVDDGSEDSTKSLLDEAKEELPLLKVLSLPAPKKPQYDRGFRYSFLVKLGFDLLLDDPETAEDLDLIGIVDADMFFKPDYFEKLLEKFKKEPTLGIASGAIYSKRGNHFVREKSRPDQPRGSGRLIRVSCLEECGGYKVYKSMDSVMNIKARNRGWQTRSFPEMKMYQSRETFSRRSYWNGFLHQGKVSYYLGTPVFVALLKACRYSLLRPHYIFLPYLYGYFKELFAKKEKVPDEETRNFYGREHLRAGFNNFITRRQRSKKKQVPRGKP